MELIIRPKKTFSWNDIKEIWQYRELFYFFAWRDLKVRYKQTAIGVAWAIFQPFMTMVVFSVFFWRSGEDSVGWRALSDIRLYRTINLAVFFNRSFRYQQFSNQ